MHGISLFLTSCLVTSGTITTAREIIFPPVVDHTETFSYPRPYDGQAPIQSSPTSSYDAHPDEDISLETDAIGGLPSFAHLPYVPCFSALEDDQIDRYDIAILGAPFDTATSYRPGARFGPHGIRDGSRRIRSSHSWSVYTGQNPFSEWAKIVDCGDAPLTFFDNTVALKQLGKAHKVRPLQIIY